MQYALPHLLYVHWLHAVSVGDQGSFSKLYACVQQSFYTVCRLDCSRGFLAFRLTAVERVLASPASQMPPTSRRHATYLRVVFCYILPLVFFRRKAHFFIHIY
jgi:hypothetical protein